MSKPRVRIEKQDHIAIVTLDRADKRNALDPAMFIALHGAIQELKTANQIRAVVLNGDGKGFCAGLDFPAFMANQGGDPADKMEPFAKVDGSPANYVQEIGYGWKMLPMPVIAALHGATLGGGLQMAMCADIRLAAPDVQMSVMEMKWGLIPDMSISQTLRDTVRIDVAKELTYTGRIVEAEEALALGLVTQVVDNPLEAAIDLANLIASKNPDAIRGSKKLFNETRHTAPNHGLELEEEIQKTILGSTNQMEAVMANFNKSTPNFKDPE